MTDGTFVSPMETTDDCLECTRCKIGDVYVDDENYGTGYEYYFTA
jgi:hypothetical protein